ncbi:MAG: NADH-quinone oxidoreductase subunit N [Polyangiaceae bacterium]|nr:NADH-quinone oxidoreductase subunit N [Polyangiaceae bacterium]
MDNVQSLKYLVPELALIGGILLIIAWDLVAKGKAKLTGIVGLAAVSLAISGGVGLAALLSKSEPVALFYGLLAADRFSNLFRVVFAFVTGVVVLFSIPSDETAKESAELDAEDAPKDSALTKFRRDPGEFFALLLVLTLGMNLMASSRNLLMIYLSLEIVSVISFVMAGLKFQDKKSSEAALKYVVYGGVASGIMLYGMSWIFGITQSLYLGECAERIVALTTAQGKVPAVVFVGTVCMLAGFGYKISAAPFHMWTPDVYEGAPTPVTAFLSVGPKAAGFAVMIRFFWDALGAADMPIVKGTPVETPWPIIAGCLAMATMTVGNLSALGQDNVKRMLAYSSIAHAGYMLLGFSVFSEAGVASIVFYVVTYCFMNLGAFLIVAGVAEQNGGDETINSFKGLGRRAPVVAAVMTVFLISLTGLPPMAGFVGKFYLFSALVNAGGTWNWAVAVVGVVNSVISLFYYSRVMRAMYLEKSEKTEPTQVRKLFNAASILLAVPTLVLGVYWGPVYDFVLRSLSMAR